MKFDEIDVMILSELQKNSRLSIRQLSKIINLSTTSLSERIKKLEDNGVIEGYTIKINKSKLGFPVDCIIKVTMRNGEYDRFKRFIENYNRSEWCYRVAGESCFLVKLSVSELSEIEAFINLVSSYAITSTIIALSNVNINENIKKFF